MTNIATVTISSLENIIELRNKILSLLLYLKFNPMESIRIVTRISDFVHSICSNEKSLKVNFEIEKNDLLNINFDILNTPVDTLKKSCLFVDAIFLPFKKHEGTRVCLSLPIQDNQYKNDKNYIQILKEHIIVKSKAELVREIKRKNEELNNLIEDLKHSATLIQSEKMRALGVLTAGVAHELNNPMMGILNFIQYCLKKISTNDKCHQALKDAENETKRCIDIVTNLLTFSHLEKEGETSDFKPVNLKILVDRVIKILSYRFKNEDITIDLQIPDKIPTILGHENRLQQVILNFITNSIDAMKTVTNKVLKISINNDNKNLHLKIIDTGEGMDEETQQQLFEPFFTTKEVGKGTGLGLSVCQSIIKDHKGSISFNSEKNKGTQFMVNLPLNLKE